MLVNDKEAAARLNSSSNLMNRLDSLRSSKNPRKGAMSLFIRPAAEQTKNETFQPKETIEKKESEDQAVGLDDILDNNDSKIKLALAHDSALKLLNDSVSLLSTKLDDVNPSKLPGVIAAANKVVESIRKERLEQERTGGSKDVHYHFYTPELRKVTEYPVIDVAS